MNKPSFFALHKGDTQAHYPTRARVCYLLRAARSRRARNIHRVGRAYLIDDANLVICPTVNPSRENYTHDDYQRARLCGSYRNAGLIAMELMQEPGLSSDARSAWVACASKMAAKGGK